VPADAVAVHGLTAELLANKPLFADLADEFLTFVGDASVVAHNAGSDSRHIKDSLYSISRNTSASSPTNVTATTWESAHSQACGNKALHQKEPLGTVSLPQI
jgi:DNA polymerase III alpha subunit (gram-positive type)